jgi:imidazolonepropionase-like amidohydrolase
MRLLISMVLAGTFLNELRSQDVPRPALPQTKPIIIRHATVHVGNGQVISGGSVVFSNGKIDYVGTDEPLPADADVIDASGKHVYPGLIAPNTTLGLYEVGAARETVDHTEVGDVNPNVRTIVAYNTDSRIIPTVRANGILVAQVTPRGDGIRGRSSVVQLDAWNWEEATLKADDGLHMTWPDMTVKSETSVEDMQKKNIDRALEQLHAAFDGAKAYRTAKLSGQLRQTDLRWEAMLPALERQQTVFIHLRRINQITAALRFVKQYGLRAVFVGAADAYMAIDMIKEAGIPIVLEDVHEIPVREDDDVAMPYKLAGLLHQNGIRFCFSVKGSWEIRNLPFHAGTAVGHGLDREMAITALTKSAAEILGMDDRIGTLEKGKDATLIVSEGDLLDMRSSRVEHAFIEGRQIDLGNRHRDLYEKFGKKK